MTALVKWIGKSADRLADALGLKRIGKALFNAFARVATASVTFVQAAVVRFVVKPLEALLSPVIDWVAEMASTIVIGFVKFINKLPK